MSDHQRLDRIESKLDDVGKALVALARLDERMVTLFKRMDSLDRQQTAHSGWIKDLETSSGANSNSLRFAERVFWIVLASGAAFAFSMFKGG